VNDDLLGEVCSRGQLHDAARTVLHAGIQRPWILAVSSTPFGGGTVTVCPLAQTVADISIINPKIPQSGAALSVRPSARQLISGMWTSPFRNNLSGRNAFPENSGHSPQGVLRLHGRELLFGEARQLRAEPSRTTFDDYEKIRGCTAEIPNRLLKNSIFP
jgi:hypothetical protein